MPPFRSPQAFEEQTMAYANDMHQKRSRTFRPPTVRCLTLSANFAHQLKIVEPRPLSSVLVEKIKSGGRMQAAETIFQLPSESVCIRNGRDSPLKIHIAHIASPLALIYAIKVVRFNEDANSAAFLSHLVPFGMSAFFLLVS